MYQQEYNNDCTSVPFAVSHFSCDESHLDRICATPSSIWYGPRVVIRRRSLDQLEFGGLDTVLEAAKYVASRTVGGPSQKEVGKYLLIAIQVQWIAPIL